MIGFLAHVGAILGIIGVAWWCSDYPNAERPASIFVLVGVSFMGIAWWYS